MEPRISLIALGVSDLERATRFYEQCLGLPRLKTPPSVTFPPLCAASAARDAAPA
jgi:catechol 2,3-dioxygenase-like lactoylglutathione lyase family enzyme